MGLAEESTCNVLNRPQLVKLQLNLLKGWMILLTFYIYWLSPQCHKSHGYFLFYVLLNHWMGLVFKCSDIGLILLLWEIFTEVRKSIFQTSALFIKMLFTNGFKYSKLFWFSTSPEQVILRACVMSTELTSVELSWQYFFCYLIGLMYIMTPPFVCSFTCSILNSNYFLISELVTHQNLWGLMFIFVCGSEKAALRSFEAARSCHTKSG